MTRLLIPPYRLENGRYTTVLTVGEGERFAHPAWPQLGVDTTALWAGA